MSVLVCLLERMFLGGNLLPFVWLGMGEEEGEAGLKSGIFFVFSALKARSSVWRVFLFISW